MRAPGSPPSGARTGSLQPMAEDCIFCQIVAGRIPAHVVAEDEHTLAFLDIAPAARGHLLVIPKRHAQDVFAIGEEDLAAVAAATKRIAERVRERLGPDGITLHQSNGRAAWQTVFHFHIHLIPRSQGDGVTFPWKPTRPDADELAALAEQLREPSN